MKEELTTKMHSELSVSQQTEEKHKAFNLLEQEKRGVVLTPEYCRGYGTTPQKVSEYRAQFEKLLKS